MEHNPNPLVSIIVITYNSAKFVLETLESCQAQTYNNIELIVSDDASQDDTVAICRQWLEVNKDKFVKTQLITVEENTGVSANLNRGVVACEGSWIKPIAGDDLLTFNCLTDFINYSEQLAEARFIFAKTKPFCKNKMYQPIYAPQEFIDRNAEAQHELLLKKGNCILGPVSFLNTKALKSIGMFDQRIPLQEDYPLWLKLTHNNNKLYFADFLCSMYRIHEDSLTSSSFLGIRNYRFEEMNTLTLQLYILPYLMEKNLVFRYWDKKIRLFFIRRNKSKINKVLLKVSYLINPFGVYRVIRKLFIAEYEYHFKYIEA